jgi:lycopene beta-cyclase
MDTTVAVLGAGPAGMAVASELVARDVPVVLVAPEPRTPWPANYGIWVDEAVHVGLDAFLERRWAQPLFLSDHGRRALRRPYARVDKAALQVHLLRRVDGVAMLPFRCVGVSVAGGRAHLSLRGGPALSADVVIDATGGPTTLSPPGAAATRYQTAWGVVADVDAHPWSPGEMVLMDFRGARSDVPATFLYAMPFDAHTVFLEETSLAAAPMVTLGRLGHHLSERLRRLGIHVRAVHDAERCVIPMDLPIPTPDRRTVPFGAAASFVHPASGYSLPRTFEAAPRVAEALVTELGRPGGHPDSAAAAAWRAAWPADLRRSDAIARFGLGLLASLPAADLARFLDGFFQMPQHHWSAILSSNSKSSTRLHAMVRLGLHLPPRLQVRALGYAGTRRHGRAQTGSSPLEVA